jgi:IS5 family transposase
LEAAVADRLSFRRFVGLSLHDQTPDHTTLWRFRQELAEDGLIEKVFAEINRQLETRKLILKQGTLVDASLIPARANPPRKPRKDAADTPPKPSADPDARWGRKGKKSVFGYKVHTGVDAGHTIIRRVHVTDASITDTEPAD